MVWHALAAISQLHENRGKRLYQLGGKFCLHTLRTLNAGFHLSNPGAFVERIHRYNETSRPVSDVDYYATMHNDAESLMVRVFDLT